MKRASTLFSALLLSFLLAACGTVGKNFDHTNVSKIKNSVTTQMEILDWFGVPYKEGEENNHIMWTYQFDKWSAFEDTRSKDLVLLFDEKNIVRAHRFTTNMPE